MGWICDLDDKYNSELTNIIWDLDDKYIQVLEQNIIIIHIWKIII